MIFLISGPSGTGKGTLIKQLVKIMSRLCVCRSHTSRQASEGEVDGVDYDFILREKFQEMVARGEFLEWAEVFGNLYGTSRAAVRNLLESGKQVILEIDVQGARTIRLQSGLEIVSIFIKPPSLEALERRIRERKRDSEESIQRRLAEARIEMDAAGEYDFVVINDDMDQALEELKEIITTSLHSA